MTRFLFVLLFIFNLLGADAVDPVNKARGGVAIEGYDAVAYFADARAVKGSAQFAHAWNGATWRFASAAHRDQFAAAPEKFAPQYGGYCAYAVSEGYTAKIDPQAWRIVEGKLYLNYSKDVQKEWEKNRSERIANADRHWPKLHR